MTRAATPERRPVEEGPGPFGAGALLRARPGLRDAFDIEAMREHLQRALLAPGADHTIDGCAVAQSVYDPPGTFAVRYRFGLTEGPPGAPGHLATVRFFPGARIADRHFVERLRPLAARAAGRPEFGTLAAAAVLPDLWATVAVFPIDPGLPTLVDATDTELMARTLAVRRCSVALGHYGRRHRCVLRYELEGPARRVAYGKVAADDRGANALRVIRALREVAHGTRGPGPAIPEVLHYSPAIRLLVLAELPGSPAVGRLLRLRFQGGAVHEEGVLTLEQAVAACGTTAAFVHTSGIEVGEPRPATREHDELSTAIADMRALAPDLAARLGDWLSTAEERLAGSSPPAHRLSHGDFTYTQLLVDGQAYGLVDFDTACQAEPALDLGQFTAHLRVACRKAERRAGVAPTDLADRLCEGFLETYSQSTPSGPAPAGRPMDDRIEAYELVSLLRLAVHSWQKLKPDRLGDALSVIEERWS